MKIPGRVFPYLCLIGIDLKQGLESGFGEQDNTLPPPPLSFPG